jgi:hypothetical protein
MDIKPLLISYLQQCKQEKKAMCPKMGGKPKPRNGMFKDFFKYFSL